MKIKGTSSVGITQKLVRNAESGKIGCWSWCAVCYWCINCRLNRWQWTLYFMLLHWINYGMFANVQKQFTGWPLSQMWIEQSDIHGQNMHASCQASKPRKSWNGSCSRVMENPNAPWEGGGRGRNAQRKFGDLGPGKEILRLNIRSVTQKKKQRHWKLSNFAKYCFGAFHPSDERWQRVMTAAMV